MEIECGVIMFLTVQSSVHFAMVFEKKIVKLCSVKNFQPAPDHDFFVAS